MEQKSKDTCSVIKTEQETYGITSVLFEKPKEDKLSSWKPGQFASISVYRNGQWTKPHPFTISCAPEEDKLRMTIKQKGEFTSKIPELSPGEKIKISGPYGNFCSDVEKQENIVMIAGGVGITPFLSVLRHFQAIKATNKVTLFWANRTLEDVFAQDELQNMQTELFLKVIYVLSREKEENIPANQETGSESFEKGHITRDIIEKYLPDFSAAFYLCGPPKMQEFVLNELQACGVDPESVQKESFNFKG